MDENCNNCKNYDSVDKVICGSCSKFEGCSVHGKGQIITQCCWFEQKICGNCFNYSASVSQVGNYRCHLNPNTYPKKDNHAGVLSPCTWQPITPEKKDGETCNAGWRSNDGLTVRKKKEGEMVVPVRWNNYWEEDWQLETTNKCIARITMERWRGDNLYRATVLGCGEEFILFDAIDQAKAAVETALGIRRVEG